MAAARAGPRRGSGRCVRARGFDPREALMLTVRTVNISRMDARGSSAAERTAGGDTANHGEGGNRLALVRLQDLEAHPAAGRWRRPSDEPGSQPRALVQLDEAEGYRILPAVIDRHGHHRSGARGGDPLQLIGMAGRARWRRPGGCGAAPRAAADQQYVTGEGGEPRRGAVVTAGRHRGPFCRGGHRAAPRIRVAWWSSTPPLPLTIAVSCRRTCRGPAWPRT